MFSPDQSYTRNFLLRAMPAEDFMLLQPHLERVKLAEREELVLPDTPIEHIHFLEGGMCSIVADQEGDVVEIGVFGREGVSGTAALLGSDRTPHKSFMQIDGTTSLRIPVDRVKQACRQSETLQTLLLRYVQALSIQAAQTAAANAHNALPERLARWLLMCHDRVDDDLIPLTHEFMSMMLAVRRSGVTVTLHVLEGSHAIRAQRGLITVLDRERLEDIAGQSYGAAEAEYRRLIGPFGKSVRSDPAHV